MPRGDVTEWFIRQQWRRQDVVPGSGRTRRASARNQAEITEIYT